MIETASSAWSVFLRLSRPCLARLVWFKEPPEPEHIKFYVLVADADHCELTVRDHIGEVGHMKLTNGRFVGVIADARPATDSEVQLFRDELVRVSTTSGAYPFTWKKVGESPAFFDCAAAFKPTV